MEKNRKISSYVVVSIVFLLNNVILAGYKPRPPRLTVIFVVDQFAQFYFDKLTPYFKHGLKHFLTSGVVYTNGHQDYGQPGTATGHAGLNTGTTGSYHGFVSNKWFDEDGNKVTCDDDTSGNALVISPEDGGTYDVGKSAHMLMVDGLSDQCVLQSAPRSAFAAYSISLKSRAAIATASKLGKALWFDDATGLMTSSKAYFDELPQWVNNFNQNQKTKRNSTFVWQRMYQKSSYPYNLFNINDYEHARIKETMLDRPLPYLDELDSENPSHFFEKTPHANQMLLDCAQECIKMHVSRKHKNRLLLWVCLSPLDKAVHEFGPHSMEAIDMLYHLDKQLQQFIRGVYRVIGKHETAFVLTADHGVMPIPELLHEKGFTLAHRIESSTFIQNINSMIHKNYGVKDCIRACKGQEVVFDAVNMKEVNAKKQKSIETAIKQEISQVDGIKNVWTFDELLHMCTHKNSIVDNMKNQLFRGRSGSIIVQPYPYTLLTSYPEGTEHRTPYDYDTHVPLIILYPGFEKKYVRQRVAAIQLANTLAELLEVPKPSASTAEILPELFDEEYQ